MGFLDPEDPNLGVVWVKGIRSPGRAQVSGLTRVYNWDIQESFGDEFASMTYRGRKLARFTLTVALWEPHHFLQWAAFEEVIKPPSAFLPFVTEMSHPSLSAMGVRAVTVLEYTAPERQPSGIWLAVLKCCEWRPRAPVTVKPRGAIPSPEKGKPIPPKTEADFALEDAKAGFARSRNAAR